MSASLEDRLRSYYRDRTDREPLPGPGDPQNNYDDRIAREEHMQRLIADAESRGGPPLGGGRGWEAAPVRIAAVAALVLALLGVGLVMVSRQEDPGPSTGPDPDGNEETSGTTNPTTTSPNTTEPTTTEGTTGSTSTTAGPPVGTGRTSVVSAFGELGVWDGSRWVKAGGEGWDPTAAGDDYDVVSIDGAVTQATSTSETDCTPAGDGQILDVGIGWPSWPDPGAIGVAGVADPLPRPVEPLDPSADVYRAAARDLVADRGVDDPDPEVRQAVRTDLDGDGRDEVIVVARRVSDTETFFGAPGDYSVVFVREVVNEQVVSRVVDWWTTTGELQSVVDFSLGAVADLNGDGRMEVVVDEQVWEGAASVVYELGDDGSVTEVLAGGCGV